MHRNLITAWILPTALASAVGAGTTLEDVVMWDYRDTAPAHTTLPDYHAWLLSWVAANPPPRLVLYVSSPCIGAPFNTFYDPTASPTGSSTPATLVDFLSDLHQANPTVEVEVFLDRQSFPSGGATGPCWGQVGTPHPHLLLPSEWSSLPLVMDWFGAMLNNPALSTGPIAGITFDPEVTAANVPGTSCVPVGTHGVAISYQQVIDWVDAWKYLNGYQTQRTGMAFEVDSANMARLNVSGFPLSSSLQSVLAAASPELNCQLSGGFPNWRASTASSLLQSAYLEVYVSCARDSGTGDILQAASFWRWQTDNGCEDGATPTPRAPAEAAAALQLNMTQQAGSPGPGTLEVATSGSDATFTGVGTRFLDWAGYTRVTAIDGSGGRVPATGQWTFSAASSNTAGTGYGSSETTSGQQLDYLYSELVMNWMYPYVNPAMAGRIYPMFSANADTLLPFFGIGTETEFLAFLDAFAAATDGSDLAHAVYTSDGTTPVAMPANWALYSLRLACESWGLGPYPSSATHTLACEADFSNEGVVGVLDLLFLLEGWGTSGGDLNGSGTTNATDLQLLLSVWQLPC